MTWLRYVCKPVEPELKRPVLFVEVKEYDNRSPTKEAQLADYLRTAKDDVGFLYVYRVNPSEADLSKVRASSSEGLLRSIRGRFAPVMKDKLTLHRRFWRQFPPAPDREG
jgi:hypothetical protein